MPNKEGWGQALAKIGFLSLILIVGGACSKKEASSRTSSANITQRNPSPSKATLRSQVFKTEPAPSLTSAASPTLQRSFQGSASGALASSQAQDPSKILPAPMVPVAGVPSLAIPPTTPNSNSAIFDNVKSFTSSATPVIVSPTDSNSAPGPIRNNSVPNLLSAVVPQKTEIASNSQNFAPAFPASAAPVAINPSNALTTPLAIPGLTNFAPAAGGEASPATPTVTRVANEPVFTNLPGSTVNPISTPLANTVTPISSPLATTVDPLPTIPSNVTIPAASVPLPSPTLPLPTQTTPITPIVLPPPSGTSVTTTTATGTTSTTTTTTNTNTGTTNTTTGTTTPGAPPQTGSNNTTPDPRHISVALSTFNIPYQGYAGETTHMPGQVTSTTQGSSSTVAYLNISGQISVSSLSSSDPCKGPFTDLPTITVWERKPGQSEWSPSTDPRDKIYVDSWGIFSHQFEVWKTAMPDNSSACNRTVKLKISYDLDGKHYETESGEIDCDTPSNQSPPPQVTLPDSCYPPEDDLPDRGPGGKFGGSGYPNRDIGGTVVSPF